MNRADVVQALIDRRAARSYLEIGVNYGLTFHAVTAPRKVAVDPLFLFDVATSLAAAAPGTVEYVDTTSDRYFESSHETFDVIFLDGLHTFDQTLRDLLYSIERLNEGGVVLIDDTVPSSYGASLPTMEILDAYNRFIGSDVRDWMGDVFRLVFFVRDYLPSLSYATVSETNQTAVWRAPRPVPAQPRTVADIAALDYASAMIRIEAFNTMPLETLLALLPA